jgi:hypothetical protein
LPFQFKLHKKLYNQTVKQLFEDYGLNFTNETQATPFTYELQSFKQLIINYLPIIKKLKQLPVDDSICYREITSCMVNKLKNNNVAIRRVNSYNGYIVQWYLNKINT